MTEDDAYVSRRVATFVLVEGRIERSRIGEPLPHMELLKRIDDTISSHTLDQAVSGEIRRQGDELSIEAFPPLTLERIKAEIMPAFPELDFEPQTKPFRFE